MLFIPTLPSPGLTLELHADIPNYLLNVYIQISKPFCKLHIQSELCAANASLTPVSFSLVYVSNLCMALLSLKLLIWE